MWPPLRTRFGANFVPLWRQPHPFESWKTHNWLGGDTGQRVVLFAYWARSAQSTTAKMVLDDFATKVTDRPPPCWSETEISLGLAHP